jgi:iron complex outermembrane receptor protein
MQMSIKVVHRTLEAIIVSLVAVGPSFSQGMSAGASPELQEIVVTAEKRSESLQKTPIAIQVISGNTLQEAGVSSIEDMTKLVPALSVWRQAGGLNSIYLRGIGSEVGNAFADVAVAQNIDGVYIARSEALAGAFLDVQRVEVLEGPQGTLYGRNSTGGAVNYITNKPTNELGGDLTVGVGDHSRREVSGDVNVPLTGTLALRAAFGYIAHDGYIQSTDMNDQDTIATRISALYKPTDAISLLVVGDYSRDGGNGVGEVAINTSASRATVTTSTPWSGPPVGNYAPLNYNGALKVPAPGCIYAPAANPLSCVNSASLPNTVSVVPNYYGPGIAGVAVNPNTIGTWAPGSSLDNQTAGIMAQLDWDLDFGTVTLVPAYRHTLRDNRAATGGFGENVDLPADQTSVELRLASPANSKVKWVGGLYYFNETQHDDENYLEFVPLPNVIYAGVIPHFDPAIPFIDAQGYFGRRYRLGDKSAAAFGQATYPVTDALRLTAGIRYSYEDKTASGYSPINMPEYAGILGPGTVNPLCPVGIGGTTYVESLSQCQVPIAGNLKSYYTTWRAGAEYDVTANSMLYANASTGFHAGGLNDGLNGPGYSNTYKPETILAYALGAKNRFFGDSLQLNIEAFDWLFKNKQFPSLTAIYPPVISLPVINVGDLPEYGLDIDAHILATKYDLFGITLEYLHATFSSFVFAPSTGSTGCPNVKPARFSGVGAPFVDCAGKPYPNIPAWSTTMSYQHTVELADRAAIVAGVRTHIQSGVDLSVGAPPSAHQSGYTKSDLWVAYTVASGKWTVTAYVNNVENTAVLTNVSPSFNAGGGDSTYWANIQDPRTYGARVHFKF